MKKYMANRIVLLLVCLVMLSQLPCHAQRGENDTIRLGGIVVDKDTFAYTYLPDQSVVGQLPRYLARQRAESRRQEEQNSQLKYNIYRVYPYAVIAAEVLKDVDVSLARLPDKESRKAYLKTVEKELNRRFKGELQNMTITQGQILVKLIDRQTGKNCYSIIKEMKGGFNAFVWQGVALLFSNNLKREYDPTDQDRDIETIVAELEANNRLRYRVH